MRGFTLVEIVVTTLIISLLTVIMLLYTKSGARHTILFRMSSQILADINRARMLTISLQELPDGILPCGYGIYFPPPPTEEYILFADQATDCATSDRQRASDGSEDREIIKLEKPIRISSATFSEVLFIPPYPDVVITPDQFEGTITLQIADTTTVSTIKVTKAGQISLE